MSERKPWMFRRIEPALCPNSDCGWGCWGDCKRISFEREATDSQWNAMAPDPTIISQLIETGRAEVER